MKRIYRAKRQRQMDKERIMRGIAAYDHERNVLLRLLRKRGFFTEKEFDSWLWMREWRKPGSLKRGHIDGDAFILGMGQNGGSRWAEMLDLLQIMMSLGDIGTRIERGLVTYVPLALRRMPAHDDRE